MRFKNSLRKMLAAATAKGSSAGNAHEHEVCGADIIITYHALDAAKWIG